MKVAVIDIGSNTIKCDIFFVKGTEFISLSSSSLRGALASHTANGYLSEKGYEVLKEILSGFVSEAKNASCEKILVFATQSLRNIDNTQQVCENIKHDVGVDIDVISGEEEAVCSFTALQMSLNENQSGIMADMGGGSLELVEFKNNAPENMCSLPLGALKVAKALDVPPILDARRNECVRQHALTFLQSSSINPKKNLYVIGGTARSIFSLLFCEKTEISTEEAEKAFASLQNAPNDSLQLIKCALPKRYDSFMTGFAIFNAVCNYFGCEKIILCKQGVRDGYLKRHLEK